MEHTDKRKCCSGMAEHAEAVKPDAAEKKAEHKAKKIKREAKRRGTEGK